MKGKKRLTNTLIQRRKSLHHIAHQTRSSPDQESSRVGDRVERSERERSRSRRVRSYLPSIGDFTISPHGQKLREMGYPNRESTFSATRITFGPEFDPFVGHPPNHELTERFGDPRIHVVHGDDRQHRLTNPVPFLKDPQCRQRCHLRLAMLIRMRVRSRA